MKETKKKITIKQDAEFKHGFVNSEMFGWFLNMGWDINKDWWFQMRQKYMKFGKKREWEQLVNKYKKERIEQGKRTNGYW